VGGSFTGGSGAVGGSFTGGTGGTGGVGVGGSIPVAGTGAGAAPSDPYAIRWDTNGYVSPGTNAFGIEGSFYFATDCMTTGAELRCTQPDRNLIGPDGQYGWAASSGVACARGTTAQVTNDATGMPAYDRQWGAILGLSLWQEGSVVFDAKAHGIFGFVVDVFAVGPPNLRINVVTPTTVGSSHFISVAPPVVDQPILFSQVLQGSWVQNPVPFDSAQISNLEFHVHTNASAPTPFDFCVENLRVVTQ
jgi:hypothetical protein